MDSRVKCEHCQREFQVESDKSTYPITCPHCQRATGKTSIVIEPSLALPVFSPIGKIEAPPAREAIGPIEKSTPVEKPMSLRLPPLPPDLPASSSAAPDSSTSLPLPTVMNSAGSSLQPPPIPTGTTATLPTLRLPAEPSLKPPAPTATQPAPSGNSKAKQESPSPGRYFLAQLTDTQRYRSFYAFIALFFGFMGLHNLYAGRYLWAAGQLLAYWIPVVFNLPSLFIPLLIMALLEIILVSKDGKGRKMPWISGIIW